MNSLTTKWVQRTAPWGLATRCVILVVISLAALAVVGAWRFNQYGPNGLVAAAVAVGICGGGAIIALLLTATMRSGPHAAVSAMLLGMLFRMGIPLFALTAFQSGGRVLVEAGVIGSILLIYPITLVTEVALSLPLFHTAEESPKAS